MNRFTNTVVVVACLLGCDAQDEPQPSPPLSPDGDDPIDSADAALLGIVQAIDRPAPGGPADTLVHALFIALDDTLPPERMATMLDATGESCLRVEADDAAGSPDALPTLVPVADALVIASPAGSTWATLSLNAAADGPSYAIDSSGGAGPGRLPDGAALFAANERFPTIDGAPFPRVDPVSIAELPADERRLDVRWQPIARADGVRAIIAVTVAGQPVRCYTDDDGQWSASDAFDAQAIADGITIDGVGRQRTVNVPLDDSVLRLQRETMTAISRR